MYIGVGRCLWIPWRCLGIPPAGVVADAAHGIPWRSEIGGTARQRGRGRGTERIRWEGFWVQASGMAEDLAQHDSGDEWLVELLSLPSSSLTRRQTATVVSSAGEAASAPGRAAHAAAGSSAGAGSTAGSLPAAGPRSSSGGSASDGRTCHPCPRCDRECTGHRIFPGDAYCTCVANHEWDSPRPDAKMASSSESQQGKRAEGVKSRSKAPTQ